MRRRAAPRLAYPGFQGVALGPVERAAHLARLPAERTKSLSVIEDIP